MSAPGGPKKPILDINALKAKLAADKAKLEQLKQETKKEENVEIVTPEKNDTAILYDPRMARDRVTRKKKSLIFVDTESKEEEVGYQSRKRHDVPDIEWWDMPYLSGNSYESSILIEKVDNAIEHSVLTIAPVDKAAPVVPAIMLTKKEQKRIRKQRREAMMQERRDHVLLGLIDAPTDKVKISNMLRVYGAEAVQDPTSLEKRVLEEMRIREERHQKRNEERKLTPEQRSEKKRRKLLEDTSVMSRVAIFRLNHLKNPSHRFKVDINAKQNFLSGCVLTGKNFLTVIVEGGPKGINRYKKLMLRRIAWNDSSATDKSGAPIVFPPNECHLVWEGDVLKPSFRDFRFESPSEGPRKYLEASGIAHYWDYAKNYKPTREDNSMALE